MSVISLHSNWFCRLVLASLLVSLVSELSFGQIFPGVGGLGRIGVVGGVSIDAQGVVRSATAAQRSEMLSQLRASAQQPSGDLAHVGQLRKVSLGRLQRAIAQKIADGQSLTDEMLYLAGLQRVQYVLVYPPEEGSNEVGDIVLAGPAEPWQVRDDASVVGQQSGRPVLRLEDLLVALRTSQAAQKDVISVSIDPTPAGEVRLRQLLAQAGILSNGNPSVLEPAMKEALGPQVVTLSTVPKTSRMAQVLVWADYQMKRLAMNLESSPVSGLPSYLEMIRDQGNQGAQPRWWMASSYDALLHSEDSLAWHITGQAVKALTEDQFVTATGKRVGKGGAQRAAQKWADLFTQKFDQLCASEAAFGEVRNMMDLNVVAALILSQEMQQRAGLDLSLLLVDAKGQLATPEFHAPQSLEPQCSFVRGQAGWVVSASGGVEFNPWRIVSEAARQDDTVKAVHSKSISSNTHWWWN
ncbi:MAG TPA: hypothetical protein DCF63_17245 [Planctomycetaceae bacterium]|nr:hypothetical protein [Planctomycetaceae bacterium]